MSSELPNVVASRKLAAPTITPQALTWDGTHLWMGSRDLKRIYKIEPNEWKVIEEIAPPGIPWAAVATNGSIRFTIGEGANDDRYVYSFANGRFEKLFQCPDLTGSYLSFDGQSVYLSQWYKQRILKMDTDGNIVREIFVGAEISGHTFVNGSIYVLRGTETPNDPTKTNEDWRIARLDPHEQTPKVCDVAVIPFASRSLTFDGKYFWSNHRAANETIAFELPKS